MPTKQLKNSIMPEVNIDPALNKYDQQVLFPEKVAKAKARLQQVGLPRSRPATDEK